MTDDPRRTIYVVKIPLDATYAEVRQLFNALAPVNTMYMNKNNFYQYAFVNFLTSASAELVLSLEIPLLIRGAMIRVFPRRQPAVQNQEAGTKLPEDNSEATIPEQYIYSDLTATEKQTLAYGTNGDLRFGCEPPVTAENYRVVRIDGVPASWQADALYKHLASSGLPITAVMVYEDFDERGLCQGLLQLKSARDAVRLCRQGSLRTSLLHLEAITSMIPSIGPIRNSYGGRFTAYGVQDESYSMEPHAFLQLQTQSLSDFSTAAIRSQNQASGLVSSHAWKPTYSLPQSASNDDGSPLWSSGTPPSEISEALEHDEVKRRQRNEGAIGTGNSHYRTAPETAARIGLEKAAAPFTGFPVGDPCPTRSSLSSMAVFKAVPLPHKPSQTIVIDNFDSTLLENSHQLAISMAQFGHVQSADLVPLERHLARAYVTFASPSEAELALSKLTLDSFGPHRFCVRLA